MTADPYVEAGARAILRRALYERDIDVGSHFPTDRLVGLVRTFDAPVEKIAAWWNIISMGRPKLTDRQRQIMRDAGRHALELFRQTETT